MARSGGFAEHAIGQGAKPGFRALGIATLLILAAVSVGWIATLDNPLYLAVPVVVLAGLFLATQPVLLFWALVCGGLLVAGVTRLYLPQVEQIRWLLAPMSLFFLAHVALANRRAPEPKSLASIPQIIWWALAFLVAAILASLMADFELKRFIIGFKGYFQVWGLLFGMAFFCWSSDVIDRLPRVLLAVAIVQIPFVAHQFMFLVPARVGLEKHIVPVDVVAGTFGASVDGGGANALLNAFLIMVLAGLVAARQSGVISASRMLVLGSVLLAPVLVNEAKVSVLYLLVLFLVLYAQDVVRRPLRFLVAGLASSGLLVLLMMAYILSAPSHAKVESWQDLVRHTYEYNLEDEETGDQLSRGGALGFWADRHGAGDAWGTLFGHGIGFTRVPDADAVQGETVKSMIAGGIPEHIDLESNIGNTAVAALLWETGVLGLACVFGLLLSTFRTAGRLARVYRDNPERAAVFRAVQVAMAIVFIALWHKNLFVLDVICQTLVILIIGYTAYWDRQARIAEADSRASGRRAAGAIRLQAGGLSR